MAAPVLPRSAIKPDRLMLAQLESLDDGPSIVLDKPILLIGRDPECDIQIDSRKISRRHCCIAQVNDYLVVRDLGSTNGIRINGNRVQEGTLKADDELVIGGSRYRLTWDMGLEPTQRKQNMGAHLEPVGDQPFAVDEDLLLESSDDPIALAEGGRPIQQKSSVALSAGPRQENTKDSRQDSKTPREIVAPEELQKFIRKERAASPIIPDSISLAPSSDSEVNVSKHSK
jgi:pSer/pThr/pTyr-binding forkhead associated (FHA) protein